MQGVVPFSSGQSGWFAIDHVQVLWHGRGRLPASRRVADDGATACIGDAADYDIRPDDTLWVKGLAHRGQYGDWRLTATADFINTARDAVVVGAHTGHALYLSQGGRRLNGHWPARRPARSGIANSRATIPESHARITPC